VIRERRHLVEGRALIDDPEIGRGNGSVSPSGGAADETMRVEVVKS
jgi:hypothetical protein